MQRVTYRVVWPFLLLLLTAKFSQAQNKCAFDRMVHALAAKYPDFQQKINQLKEPVEYRSAVKNTITEPYTIPVVFHFLLTQQQINAIGGEDGIRQRIDSQMLVLNRDFNAANFDYDEIPNGFKPLYGDVNIRFALAHTDPYNKPTEGYHIKTVSQAGFEIEGGTGSGIAFSDAKYTSAGGMDAWDVESYLNIWVVAPLDGGKTSDVLGLAIPEYFAEDANMPAVEQGIVVHYGAVGRRSIFTEIYVKGADEGRTLTHEVGHMFELFHIWGDDDGKCPDNGGGDDGISDTPPQAYPSSGCLVYPKYDGCTRNGDGIMFMNYMDYSDDRCALMFSKEQAQRMQRTWQPGGGVYSLTQHPWLLTYPADSNSGKTNNTHVVYPNPADGVLNISFRLPTDDLQHIMLIDMTGRAVLSQEVKIQAAFYTLNTGNLHAGLYFLVLHYGADKVVERVLVR